MSKPMTPEENRHYMMNTPMRRLIPSMAIPTILAMLVSSLYNLTDTYFVSTLGTYATSAVGVNVTLDHFVTMAGCFFSVGAASLISRLLGSKREEEASQVLSTCFFITFSFGLVVLLLGTLFTEPLVRLLGATDNITQYAKQYSTYVLLAAPFTTSSFVLNQSLRAEGAATRAMIGTMTGAIINIILDPIFIFLLDLGVAGASIATAISKLLSFVLLFLPYQTSGSLLQIRARHIRFHRHTLIELGSLGASSLLRNLLSITALILLNNIAGRYSESALAAISIVNRMALVLLAVCMGFGNGFQPVAGYFWGAGEYRKIEDALFFSMKTSASILVGIGAVVFLFAKPIIGLFTKDDLELLRLGVVALRAQCVCTPLFAIAVLADMLCVGIGSAKDAVLLSAARQGYCFLPILPLMVWLFGEYGIATVQAAADGISSLMSLFFIRKSLKLIRRKRDRLK